MFYKVRLSWDTAIMYNKRFLCWDKFLFLALPSIGCGCLGLDSLMFILLKNIICQLFPNRNNKCMLIELIKTNITCQEKGSSWSNSDLSFFFCTMKLNVFVWLDQISPFSHSPVCHWREVIKWLVYIPWSLNMLVRVVLKAPGWNP